MGFEEKTTKYKLRKNKKESGKGMEIFKQDVMHNWKTFIMGKQCLVFAICIHIREFKMEMQIKFSEVLPLATISSYSPAELLKTSNLHHAIILALRPRCCRAMPGLDGFLGFPGDPTTVLQT